MEMLKEYPSPEKKSEEERLKELTEILSKKANEQGLLVAHNRIVDFVDKLEMQYKNDSTVAVDESIHQIGHPKLNPVRLYHVLIGSSIDLKIITTFDLPNGEIEKFIREEL